MTAFACNKCPRTADLSVGGCPVWWEVLERHNVTDAERLTADCGFRIMPRFLTDTMRMAHRAAAQSTADREVIGAQINGAVTAARGLAIATALAGGRGKSREAISSTHDVFRQLEHVGTKGGAGGEHAGGGHDERQARDLRLASRLDDVRHDAGKADLVDRLSVARRNGDSSVDG